MREDQEQQRQKKVGEWKDIEEMLDQPGIKEIMEVYDECEEYILQTEAYLSNLETESEIITSDISE